MKRYSPFSLIYFICIIICFRLRVNSKELLDMIGFDFFNLADLVFFIQVF